MSFDDTHSKLAIISQLRPALISPGSGVTNFTWDRLDGRPLIFARLGTLQNRLPQMFRCIVAALAELPFQLVLSLGGGLSEDEVGMLPGDPVVVTYAPQRELLERARLMITHAGMNNTFDCIAHGVPMVAIPIAHDQPRYRERTQSLAVEIGRIRGLEQAADIAERAMETGAPVLRDAADLAPVE